MTFTTVFAGVANVLVTDGSSSVHVDGYFSRPSLPRLLAGRVRPSLSRSKEALARLEVDQLDAVLVSHSHFDCGDARPSSLDSVGATGNR